MFTINGDPLDSFGAKMMDFEPKSASIKQNLYVPPETGTPILLSSRNDGKMLTMRVSLEGGTRDAAWESYSKLKRALQDCTLHDDTSKFYYDGKLAADEVTKWVMGRPMVVTFNLMCVQREAEIVRELTQCNLEYTIQLNSTAPTPAVIWYKSLNPTSAGDVVFKMNRAGSTVEYDHSLSDVEHYYNRYQYRIDADAAAVQMYYEPDDAWSNVFGQYSCRKWITARVGAVPYVYFKETADMPMLYPGVNHIMIVNHREAPNFSCTLSYKPRWL